MLVLVETELIFFIVASMGLPLFKICAENSVDNTVMF